ncbi:MAG: ribosomal RNA small subunit methyltransferase A [Phycisphaerales bacterium]|nr:ribosomal RNA small subunit methyltransferase A [Phycisphaerales bacterium]
MSRVQTLAEIKSLLEAHGLRPKRSLGQNFLIDHNLIRKLVDASGVRADDLVLEVGPGTGTMTEELLARGCRVVVCELDDALSGILADSMPGKPGGGRFTLVHGDCLDDKRTLSAAAYKALRAAGSGEPRPAFTLVSNLPYGAATPLMLTLLLHHPECAVMAVTIQKEVADRLLARPGTKDYGALAVIAQALASMDRIAGAPPECFWPRPEVTSSMVLLARRADPLTRDAEGLSEFCRVIFAQRRKQVGSLLGREVDWNRVAASPGCAAIVPTVRAESLTPEQVVSFGCALGRIGPDQGNRIIAE